MWRRTNRQAAPGPVQAAKERDALRNALGAAGVDGSHPEWNEVQTALIGQMKESRSRLEAGRGQQLPEDQRQRLNEDRRYQPNHAALFFPDTKTALEATRRAFANMMAERDSTYISQPTEHQSSYNFGSEVVVRGVDGSRMPGNDGPRLDARTPAMLPVSLRLQVALRHFEPADIKVMNAHCEKHGITPPKAVGDDTGPGESIAMDITTSIVRPIDRDLNPKLVNGLLEFDCKDGAVVSDYLDREESVKFLKLAHAALPGPDRIPLEYTVANAIANKALGVDRSAGQVGPPALDVLTGKLDGKLATLAPQERQKVISEAHKVAAVLYTGVRTGIVQGAALGVTLKGMDDLFRKGLGIAAPSTIPGVEPQTPGESSRARLSVVGEGSLVPANISRLAIKLGGMIPAQEVVQVRPSPFRGHSTILAFKEVQKEREDRTQAAINAWSRG